jgi:formylglycine-generating enzyme required for sulfatase activity
MSGNVWEWCWDQYDSGYYSTIEFGSTDPRGPLDTAAYVGMSYSYVVRGGSYYNDWDRARNAFRGYDLDDALYINYGFRIVTNW